MAIADLFRDAKLKLFGKPFSQGDKSPSLEVDVWKGNVGITVYTNSERDNNPEKRIKAPMSFRVLSEVIETVQGYCGIGILAGQLPSVTIFENYTSNKDANGERAEGRTLLSTTQVGTQQDGTIFISVVDADQSRPQIKFVFGGDNWHKYVNADTGQPLEPKLVSKLGAMSWAKSILAIIPPAMVALAEAAGDTKAGGEGGGQGGGGYKKPYNGGGGYQGGNGGGGGYQKKQWNNNGGGGGGYQKKQWNGNNGGGGGYQGGNGGGYNRGGNDGESG